MLKLHLPFARAICQHNTSGKSTEATKKRRLAFLEDRMREHHGDGVDVIIVATKRYSAQQTARGVNQVVGIVRMGPCRSSTLQQQAHVDSWATWNQTDLQSFNAACKHMEQGMHQHDAIFEYPILHSVYLEQENMYVQCPAMREFAKHGAVMYAAHH